MSYMWIAHCIILLQNECSFDKYFQGSTSFLNETNLISIFSAQRPNLGMINIFGVNLLDFAITNSNAQYQRYWLSFENSCHAQTKVSNTIDVVR